DLSTVAGNKISNPPWVKFQSAGWVNFPSAPTLLLRSSRRRALFQARAPGFQSKLCLCSALLFLELLRGASACLG
ncbi:hypothetical protein, partial [Pseudomonas peli]|uniref:hypothetical protein n=1 Tax=Pseudomonas peli TaxID=592361 RepID=UPI00286BB07E